jgi:acyl-CoA reductase-like NAD-dependent aldehyde dehydrogenase
VLQSGGKNAVIVDSTADLKLAVHCVTEGALTTAGQRCTSTSRVFVNKSILEPFSAALVEAFKKVPTGRTDDPASKETDPLMGPLYSSKALDKYLRFQTMAHRDAARTLLWGKTIEGAPGFHVTPSVHYVTKFDNASAYQGNVLFAPDVAVYDFDTVDLAISQINTTDASFAVSFIGDPEILVKRRAQFLAPNLIVNGSTIETSATLPLAGRLQSGHHRYHGPGVAFYLCYPQILLRRQPGLSKTRLES